MYGTRDAPAAWQKMLGRVMRSIGFSACKSVPCMHIHAEKSLRVVIHVDDFLISGEAPELEWAEAELAKVFTLKNWKWPEMLKRDQVPEPNNPVDAGRT